jgi:hypothetical protein
MSAVAGEQELTGLRLGTAVAAVDTKAAPQSRSAATQAIGVAGPEQSVHRSAGSGGREPGSVSHDGPGVELSALTLGSSRLTANAYWGVTADRAARPVGLSSALARPGQLVVHPDTDTPLLQVWRGSQGRSQTQLVAVPGQPTLGIRATARAELTAVTLFGGAPTELTIRFMTAPSLVAVAAGTDRTAVHYAPPTIAVTAAQGRTYRLDTAGETVDIPLIGPGGCGECGGDDQVTGVVRISLGGARERIGHTSVDATAAAVRLQVLGVPGVGQLLDTTLGDLDVSARVPLGGLIYHQAVSGTSIALPQQPQRPAASSNVASPPAETPSPAPTTESPQPQPVAPSNTPDEPTLPVTGTNLGVLAALGLTLLGIGWVVLRATRRPR